MSGFATVGLLGAAIDFGLFNLLVVISWDPIAASFVSVTLAGIAVFFGNLLISFRHVNVSSKLASAFKFLLLAVATIIANNLLVSVLLSSLEVSSVIEMNLIKAVVVGALTAIRFVAMKFFVYTR